MQGTRFHAPVRTRATDDEDLLPLEQQVVDVEDPRCLHVIRFRDALSWALQCAPRAASWFVLHQDLSDQGFLWAPAPLPLKASHASGISRPAVPPVPSVVRGVFWIDTAALFGIGFLSCKLT